jgi:hypothetical protein
MRNPVRGGPGYSAEIEPLLGAMETRFAELADRGDALRARIPARARSPSRINGASPLSPGWALHPFCSDSWPVDWMGSASLFMVMHR